ncbi:lipopolysaccharide assembly protein LapA domain-containing protein [Nocardioides sp. CFH 31398]|uniref:lipopolysaccharide assembly protein LapA domain-containing protein n=1 Tax=Nocardioides sp. CFH 31398 TaxID=2919579 RepID=UPI001F065710|nr:lipopolysaccharide assembly protein LapA domain-containing protein [Nocardioides sp. CFH 31398]MCH1865409.1 lipopolysaccharide assembly protein LapA domain-containing protein [Nocardioides sp. CFH 31398]
MSQQDPVVGGQPANQPPPAPTYDDRAPEPTGRDAVAERQEEQEQRRVKGSPDDPLRGSATGHVWVILVLMVVVLVLLAVFILQNLESVQVNYFGATGSSPLAVALLLAFAAGLAVAGLAGTARILQLRRRVRKADR